MRTEPRSDLHGRQARRRRAYVFATKGGVCVVCGEFIDMFLPGTHPDGPMLEHIVPVSRGGHPTDISNLAVSHNRCGLRKGNKLQSEMRPDQHEENWP
jgi:5-methylcytosine-specific restriction endonuclease McrA